MQYDSDNPIPGTNGEMTEKDLYSLLKRMHEKGNFEHCETLPQPESGIKTLVMTKKGTLDELIEENRQLYKARAWEQYV